jgi:2-keto-4-pentenoate hydratase/2-oxohepta-3-ene-1,7-dioic acid hydratase in catechol pathway
MKLVRIRFQDQIHWAQLDGETCRPLETNSAVVGSSACPVPSLDIISKGSVGQTISLSDVQILAPVVGMEKIICIGTNYAEHAREMGGEPPTIPVVFSKFPSAIIGPGDPVVHPAICTKLDFEAELVVVIGKDGRHIARENAWDHVLGYCSGNDISARDWQKEKPGGQWLLGKTFDTFAPLGPMIVTRDEIPDPHQLPIQFRLNGEVMQDSNTDQLIFSIDFLISHLSQFFTLKRGDLIFTGTPPGVGAGRKPPIWLKPGDLMEVEIADLGVLRNPVVSSKDSR